MASHSALTLLRRGLVLTHGANDQVIPIQADLLIKGNLIHEIAPNIQVSADTEIIDCTEKILCPGFIDTHHHLWQTLLKGRHANELLLEYMYSGNLQSSNHTATDIFWAQLSGCLESLNAGTTTVVDHAHMNYSPEHSQAAIAATVSSGLRSVFCYTPTSRLDSWSPFAMNHDLLADWVIQTLENLAGQAPFGDGRVELGFGFDGFSLPKVKALGIKLITSHYAQSAVFGDNSRIAQLASYNLLDESILFSHASFATPLDGALLKKCNAHVSSTPSTELQMGMGDPVAFSSSLNIQSHSSLGIDCHTVTSASIPAEMRLLLQTSRNTHSQQFVDSGKAPSKIYKTAEEAFNLGTIAGARAVGMEAKIGSLSEGKLADIAVFDALSPGMVAAAQRDPVAAVVLHSSPGDIVMTIVDGLVRKESGKLNRVQVAEDYRRWMGGQSLSLEWNDVAKEVVQRSWVLNEKIAKLDLVMVREEMMKAFHIDPKNIVDSIPDI